MSTPEELDMDTEMKAFHSFKKNIARGIFRSSRAARKVHVSQASSTNPISVPRPVFEPLPPVPASRVVFTPLDPLSNPRAAADVHVGSRGLASIMDEVRCLSHAQEDDGTLYIRDPEAAEDRGREEKEIRLMEHKVKDADGNAIPDEEYSLIDEGYRHRIRISEDSQHRVVMQGEARALAGLMERLRDQDLIHPSQWFFDGMEVVREGNWSWSLSNDTQSALKKVEDLLQAGAGRGMVEVRVEQIFNGKKLTV